MIYKFSQLVDRVNFQESNTLRSKKVLHFGQLKLLFSEILYLSKSFNPNSTVVYIGVADDGFHISFLADMFKELNFELWDKAEFGLELRSNIKLINRFFTN